MEKFEIMRVDESFLGIEIKSIKNIHTGSRYDNIYFHKGFRVSDGTAYPVYTKDNEAYFGHMVIETSFPSDATELCKIILDICL